MMNLKPGDWVKYKMNYNGSEKHWPALVTNLTPLELKITFDDGYSHIAQPDSQQLKFIAAKK